MLFFAACAGCKSRAPMVKNHEVTFQKKLHALHHWRVLSADLVKSLQQNVDVSGRTVFVEVLGNETEFSEAFGKLVVSTLNEHGIKVSTVEKGADIKLVLANQAVFHGRRFATPHPLNFINNSSNPLLTLPLAVGNLVTGDDSGSPGQTRGELLVTAWAHQKGRVLHCSNHIAYVPVKDAPLYVSSANWDHFERIETSRRGYGNWLSACFGDDSRW